MNAETKNSVIHGICDLGYKISYSDFGLRIKHEVYAVRDGFKARHDSEVLERMRYYWTIETGAGFRPSIGQRIGLLLLRGSDRVLFNEELREKFVPYKENLEDYT